MNVSMDNYVYPAGYDGPIGVMRNFQYTARLCRDPLIAGLCHLLSKTYQDGMRKVLGNKTAWPASDYGLVYLVGPVLPAQLVPVADVHHTPADFHQGWIRQEVDIRQVPEIGACQKIPVALQEEHIDSTVCVSAQAFKECAVAGLNELMVVDPEMERIAQHENLLCIGRHCIKNPVDFGVRSAGVVEIDHKKILSGFGVIHHQEAVKVGIMSGTECPDAEL